MTINIVNTEFNSKFNVGDTVYRISKSSGRELCSKCHSIGFTEPGTECIACNGEGSRPKTFLQPKDKPYIIKHIIAAISDTTVEFGYIPEDLDAFFEEGCLFSTLNNAIEYCKRENSIETIPLADIVVPKSFLGTYPSPEKMTKRIKELKKHGKFTNIIEVDRNNVLVDGYTTYVLAKGFGHTEVEVIRHDNK